MAGALGNTLRIADPFFGSTDDEAEILWQACEMRLDTRRGTLPSSPNYGLAVQDYLLEALTAERIVVIPAEVQAELEKDERIAGVDVAPPIRVALPGGGQRIELVITIHPKTGESFTRTMSVADLTVDELEKDD